METDDLSEHGTHGLRMKGDREMPGRRRRRRVFKKPTYLNICGEAEDTGTIQSKAVIVSTSVAQRKVSFVGGGRWSGKRIVPVFVKGLENSCCRSLFSDVLSTTTMSAGRVSLFFSRNPFPLYITCGVGRSQRKYTVMERFIRLYFYFLRFLVHLNVWNGSMCLFGPTLLSSKFFG